jgi:hydrogenase expression/formation protein HypD
MKYIKEFRDVSMCKKIIKNMHNKSSKPINIMEVCGSHTMAIYKNGIDKLIPSNINLISGPGCPVCVTPREYIDKALELSEIKNVIITTFGDMVKLPGSFKSLREQRAIGADIRVVYCPLDCIKIAEENPNKEVVFLAVGFETTTPIIALAVKEAKRKNLKNFTLLQNLKTMPGIMEKIILDEETSIDGFICPGNVSSIIGSKAFENLSKTYNMPMVIAGFESCDVLCAIYMLMEMLEKSQYSLKNIYKRLVKPCGNEKAKQVVNEVFSKDKSFWRGFGFVENTGLKFNENYKEFNAENKFNIEFSYNDSEFNEECICEKIIKGIKKPYECSLFSKVCNPQNPIGPCMVSVEGSCFSYYKYGEYSFDK